MAITSEHEVLSIPALSLVRARPAVVAGTPARSTTSVTLVEETDEYTSAISGAHVNAFRIGARTIPSRVLEVSDRGVTVTTCEIEFPMISYTQVPEDCLVVAAILEGSRESRWCATPLFPGMVVVYGPGADHLALNQPGLRFTFGTVELGLLGEVARSRQARTMIPAAGSVQFFPESAGSRAVGDALRGFTDDAFIAGSRRSSCGSVLQSVETLLATQRPLRCRDHGSGIDSRVVVRDCVEFAASSQQIPSLKELCAVANVSERRLRTAFTDQFGRPPSRFFLAWGLGLANSRLREADPNDLTVTEVATALGFGHLGRFADHYRQLYRESPSATLRRVVHEPLGSTRAVDVL